MTDAFDPARVEADVRRWLERAVIGLNLCPFAKAVYARNQVRIVVSDASTERALLEQLVGLDRVVKSQPLLENDFSC